MSRTLTFYEFFAGGGMARLGLGDRWTCLLANDFDPLKTATYRENFGGDHLRTGDVFDLEAADLPGRVDLAWASSPCQDFSLAGKRAGLTGGRSSAFFGFWTLMKALNAERRAPKIIVIENVVGMLSANGGDDFTALCSALAGEGYRFGAVEIDASRFVPQSRPRVFVVATKIPLPKTIQGSCVFHSKNIAMAFSRLPDELRPKWVWWNLPEPPKRNETLSDVIEDDAVVKWHTPEQTKSLLQQKGPAHRLKTQSIVQTGKRTIGAGFRRMRLEKGKQEQRFEVRFDGIAGCIRTPSGGSSRQKIVVVDGDGARTRLLSPREGARLMGIPDDYKLPSGAVAAFRVIGDGVVVNTVAWLSKALIEPLLQSEDGANSDAEK